MTYKWQHYPKTVLAIGCFTDQEKGNQGLADYPWTQHSLSLPSGIAAGVTQAQKSGAAGSSGEQLTS